MDIIKYKKKNINNQLFDEKYTDLNFEEKDKDKEDRNTYKVFEEIDINNEEKNIDKLFEEIDINKDTDKVLEDKDTDKIFENIDKINNETKNIIKLIRSIDIYSLNTIDYSQIKFNIETSNCTSCNVDGYTLILKDFSLFKSFLNFNSIYLIRIFNMFKNILRI